MAVFWSSKIFEILAIFAQIFCQVLASTKNVGKEQCIGKYQLGIDSVTSVHDPFIQIKFNGLEDTPFNSTIENNGHTLKIELSYTTVPTMKVRLDYLGVVGEFRLKFLYFQWFKTVPRTRFFHNVSFPAELHAVFYNLKARSYDAAAVLDKNIIVLAFPTWVGTADETLFAVLRKSLKNVREPNRKSTLKNISLRYWNVHFPSKYLVYYAYEGTFSEFSCQATVIWIDMVYLPLGLKKETVDEFKKLKSKTGGPLMSQVSEFLKPKGTVYTNKENTVLAMPGLIIVVLFLIFYSY